MLSFMEWHLISLIFLATLKLEMKQGLEGQTRAQRQGDFPGNLNGIHQPFGGWYIIVLFLKRCEEHLELMGLGNASLL